MKKVLCCLLTLTLLLSGCGKSENEKVEMGELCPFSYETKKDGTVELIMDTTALDGFYWQVDMQSGEVCELAQSSEGTLVTYTVKGLAEGTEIISFLCRESEAEYSYERFSMKLSVAVAQDLSVTATTASYKDYNVGGSGENSDYYYAWNQDAKGNLIFTFQSNGDIQWSADCDGEAVELGGMSAGVECRILTVTPLAAGEASVTLTSKEPPQKLVVTFAVDEDRGISVTSVDTSGIRDGALISPKPVDDQILEEDDMSMGLEPSPELDAPPDDGPTWGLGWPTEEEAGEVSETAPVTPAMPVTPVAPAAPVMPATPVTPQAPAAPVEPVEPAAPEAPAETLDPTAAVTPAAPAESAQTPAVPAEPAPSAAPAESAELQEALDELAKLMETIPAEVAGNG